MDEFSPNRRVVNDINGLNRFLTRMYGLMTLAVLVSALTADETNAVAISVPVYAPAINAKVIP